MFQVPVDASTHRRLRDWRSKRLPSFQDILLLLKQPLAFIRHPALHHRQIVVVLARDVAHLREDAPHQPELFQLLQPSDSFLKLNQLGRRASERLEYDDARIDLRQ